MPINCVVGGCCRNQNNSPESSFYRFPSDSSCQRLWVRFVDNTRSDFVRTQNSRVCSAHFVHGDFEPSSLRKSKFGMAGTCLLLKAGTALSVQRPSCSACTCTCTSTRTYMYALHVRCKNGTVARVHVDYMYFPVLMLRCRL